MLEWGVLEQGASLCKGVSGPPEAKEILEEQRFFCYFPYQGC